MPAIFALFLSELLIARLRNDYDQYWQCQLELVGLPGVPVELGPDGVDDVGAKLLGGRRHAEEVLLLSRPL